MTELISYINTIAPLETEAANDLEINFQTKTFERNEFLLRPDKVCNYLYFVEEGLVKSFFYNGDKEFVLAFYQKNMMLTELSSFISRRPSRYMLVAMEQTKVAFIHRQVLEELCKKHHSLETFLRKLYALTSECFMHRISEMLEEDAKQRYLKFIGNYPGLSNRISLGDMASYIGINQTSLSRIRAAR